MYNKILIITFSYWIRLFSAPHYSNWYQEERDRLYSSSPTPLSPNTSIEFKTIKSHIQRDACHFFTTPRGPCFNKFTLKSNNNKIKIPELRGRLMPTRACKIIRRFHYRYRPWLNQPCLYRKLWEAHRDVWKDFQYYRNKSRLQGFSFLGASLLFRFLLHRKIYNHFFCWNTYILFYFIT